MRYVSPGQPGSIVSVEPRYDNFIDGKWMPPAEGKYRVNLSPATAQPIVQIAQAGADTFVAGSAIFGHKDYREIVAKMLHAVG